MAMKTTLAEAIATAQKLSTDRKEEYGVWQHVGQFGQLGGDIPGTYTYKFTRLSQPDPPDTWALVATVMPDTQE